MDKPAASMHTAVMAQSAVRIVTLKRLTLVAAVLAYGLIVLGNFVRITNSGLGCPDWPLCDGRVIPVMQTEAVIEVAHRVFAALVSSLVVLIAALTIRWQPSKTLVRLSVGILVLLGVQILLGALTVWLLLYAVVVAAHLASGMALLGCLVAMSILLHSQERSNAIPSSTNRATRDLRRFVVITASAVFVLIVTGGLVSGSGAALACGLSWPLCNGGLMPDGSALTDIQWIHRIMVIVVSVLVSASVIRVLRLGPIASQTTVYKASWRWLKGAAVILVIAFFLQALVGALMVKLARPQVLATLHNAIATLVWVSVLTQAMLALTLPIYVPDPEVHPVPAWRQTLKSYLILTKPRVISLLLVTTLAAMLVTPAGAPPLYLIVWTLIGGYLMAGGANAVNMAYDHDIDSIMARTRLRPVPSGRISSRKALVFGLALAILAFLVFALFVNILAAFLSLLGFLYYTLVYTRWLKRTTWQNIVIGGGAGAIPTLVGWAAGYGQLTWTALLLFVIVFYWTPPHFWALALLKQKDYAEAGVPMLPVIAGIEETAHQMWLYAWGMVAISVLLVPLQAMGLVYLIGAVALGAVFLYRTWQVNRLHTPLAAWSLYKYSLLYLAVLFTMMILDRVIARSFL